MAVLGIGGIYMKKGLVFLYDRSAMVRRYINIGDYIQLCTIYIKQKPDND